MEDAVELSRIYLAASIPPFGDRSWYATDLLATALSAGKSSPLFKDLVYTRRIATDVSAFVLPTEAAGSFVVVATARPGIDVLEVTSAVEAHLQVMIQDGPEEIDIERARNKVLTALTDQFQRLDDRADLLSMFTTYFDDPGRIASEPRIYADLGRDELARVAGRYLRPEARVTLTVIPGKN